MLALFMVQVGPLYGMGVVPYHTIQVVGWMCVMAFCLAAVRTMDGRRVFQASSSHLDDVFFRPSSLRIGGARERMIRLLTHGRPPSVSEVACLLLLK